MSYKSKDIGVIYKLVSPSGKCYIGQSWNYKHRWNCYKNNWVKHQPKLERAFNKYGSNNFLYKIICICKNQEELDKKEIYYIKKINSIKNGYNCRLGGLGGKMSEESKKKVSIGRRKWLETHPNNFTGKRHTEETKNKLSRIRTGVKKPPRTQEWKKNMSELMKRSGRVPPSWKGKKHKKETITKMANTKSQLWKLTSVVGKIFIVHNLKQFCRDNSIHYSNLCRVAKGYRKSCQGWAAIKLPN